MNRQSRIEPRPQVTGTENLVKFEHVFFSNMRQTNTLIAVLRTRPGGVMRMLAAFELTAAWCGYLDTCTQ